MTSHRAASYAQVFRDTRAAYESIPELAASIRASVAAQFMVPCTEAVPSAPARFETPARVLVSPKRSFEAASAYRGQPTAVLNFANFHHPGGGVVNGARAQEESLCRCSTLYPCLTSEAMMTAFYLPHRADSDHRYTDDCIYTPGVTVFKCDTASPEMLPMDEWYQVDVITAAAPNVAYLDEDPSPEELRALHISRLTRILDVCARQGAEVVILGAFGCGAFGNDPEIVARAMAEVVARYRRAFRTIEFAVMSGKTPTKNYATFVRIMGEAFPDCTDKEVTMTDTAPRIVVMGGSFNPPTVAHFRLMQSALDAIGGTTGIFVPSSHNYVRKKMHKTDFPDEVLSEEERVALLKSMCALDPRMTVSAAELGQSKTSGHTLETLRALQAEHPGASIHFLFGADKLKSLPRWPTYEALVSEFRLLLFERDGVDPEKLFARSAALAAHRDAFVFIPAPGGLEGISSTEARARLREGTDTSGLLLPCVAKGLAQIHARQLRGRIDTFRGDYGFLSNFHEAAVTWEGLTYPNSEAAFQAAKVLTREERLPFTAMNGRQAKSAGKKVPLRSDWLEVKTGIMEEIVRAKFTQNPDLAARLLATGEKELVEGNRWGDTCWGVDLRTGRGENRLGRILMKVRDELRARMS